MKTLIFCAFVACLTPIKALAQADLVEIDVDAMATLDAQIDAMRTQVMTGSDLEAGDGFRLSDPFVCDLPSRLDQLDQELAQADELTKARWHVLIDQYGIEAMANDTLPQRCARTQTLSHLLAHAGDQVSQECQPVERALRLANLVARVPREAKDQFGPLLADLTRAQADLRAAGAPASDLCPSYNRLETLMLQTLHGTKEH